ncbi:MAG: hypothetical protein ACKO4Q_19430, partial [Planctomycetota bacterium]
MILVGCNPPRVLKTRRGSVAAQSLSTRRGSVAAQSLSTRRGSIAAQEIDQIRFELGEAVVHHREAAV